MAIFNVCTRCHKTMWFTKATKCTSCVEHDERIKAAAKAQRERWDAWVNRGVSSGSRKAVYTPHESSPVHVPTISTHYDSTDTVTNAIITSIAMETLMDNSCSNDSTPSSFDSGSCNNDNW